MIVGSDIIFWPAFITPLIETIKYCFDRNPNLKVYIAVCKRIISTEK